MIKLHVQTTALVTQIAGMFLENPNNTHRKAEVPIIVKVAREIPFVWRVRMVFIVCGK